MDDSFTSRLVDCLLALTARIKLENENENKCNAFLDKVSFAYRQVTLSGGCASQL